MEVYGRVLDKDSMQPIPGASIVITTPAGSSTGAGTSANANGEFYLNDDIADYPNYLTISAVGHQTMRAQLYEDFFIDYSSDFLLPRRIKDLPPVVVTAQKKFPYWLLLIPSALLLKEKKKVGKIDKGDVQTGLLIAGGIIGISVITKLLNAFGLGPGAGSAEQEDPNSAFKPNYFWTNGSPTRQQWLNEHHNVFWNYCYDIYNAFTVAYDDFEAIMNVFNQLQTKTDVSYLAGRFSARYGVDLLSFLKNGGGILPWDGLSDTHIKQLLNYVKNLPVT